jgi:hypothetical protein
VESNGMKYKLKENKNDNDRFTLSRLHATNKHEYVLVKKSIFPTKAGATLKPP